MEACIFFNIRRVDRIIGQIFDRHLSKAGLKPTQFTLLRALHAMGRKQLPEIAEALLIDRTTLTRNFKILEKEGWIRIEPGADRRTRYIMLTEEGESKFVQATPHWQAAQDSVVGRFGRENWQALRQDLHILVDRARDLS